MTPVVILGGVGAAPSEYWAHDGFQPPADTSLHLHTPEVTPDGAWGDYSSTRYYTALASGGHAGAVFGRPAQFQTPAPSADYEVGIIWTFGGNPAGSEAPVVYARSDLLARGDHLIAAVPSYRVRVQLDTSLLQLHETDGTTANSLANASVTFHATNDHELVLRVVGTSITVEFDGSTVITHTNSVRSAAGHAGFAMRDRTSWLMRSWRVKLL